MLVALMFAISGCDGSNDSNAGKGGKDPGTGQFEKGVALFGNEADNDGIHFTQHLTPKLGVELAKTPWKYKSDDPNHLNYVYDSMTAFYIDGKQYVMGLTSEKENNEYRYFIQRIFPSGDFGPKTDGGYWSRYYKTLISMTNPDGRVFIFGQSEDDKRAFTQEVLPGGVLAEEEAWHTTEWDHYWDTAAPLPLMDRACFLIHRSHDDDPWCIECLDKDGKVYEPATGYFDYGYQVAVAYRGKGYTRTHLFIHRHHLVGVHYRGPWEIYHVKDSGHMGSETDSNKDGWDHYWASMTAFESPETDDCYLFGHNTDKNYFIQHVSHLGHMDEQIESGGPWAHYYKHLFPIDFDPVYLQSDRWMGRLRNEVSGFGNRKLKEIALPGSHDSGMSEAHGCQYGGHECNTLTQFKDIGGQLELGARYFDIRPMLDTDDSGSSKWTTGHGAKLGHDTAGCRGESKLSFVNGLQDFFSNSDHANELVILKISHCATPPGNGYDDCTDTQIKKLAENLAWHLKDYLVMGDLDLKNMTLNEILAKGNIILVFTGDVRDTENGIYRWGYGSGYDYYLYDEYSNTNDFWTMYYDQLDKLRDPKNHAEKYYGGFLLSWTLTLDKTEEFNCFSGAAVGITDLAVIAQPRIYENIYTWVQPDDGYITKTLFPNILYVDTFNRTATNAAIYLNEIYEHLDE